MHKLWNKLGNLNYVHSLLWALTTYSLLLNAGYINMIHRRTSTHVWSVLYRIHYQIYVINYPFVTLTTNIHALFIETYVTTLAYRLDSFVLNNKTPSWQTYKYHDASRTYDTFSSNHVVLSLQYRLKYSLWILKHHHTTAMRHQGHIEFYLPSIWH